MKKKRRRPNARIRAPRPDFYQRPQSERPAPRASGPAPIFGPPRPRVAPGRPGQLKRRGPHLFAPANSNAEARPRRLYPRPRAAVLPTNPTGEAIFARPRRAPVFHPQRVNTSASRTGQTAPRAPFLPTPPTGGGQHPAPPARTRRLYPRPAPTRTVPAEPHVHPRGSPRRRPIPPV